MASVQFIADHSGHRKGDVVECSENEALAFITVGKAVAFLGPVPEPEPEPEPEEPEGGDPEPPPATGDDPPPVVANPQPKPAEHVEPIKP